MTRNFTASDLLLIEKNLHAARERIAPRMFKT